MYEFYIPAAKQLESRGISFDDSVDYQFTCTGTNHGFLWTKDVHYNACPEHGIPAPPPEHPEWGSPIAPDFLEFVRPATNG